MEFENESNAITTEAFASFLTEQEQKQQKAYDETVLNIFDGKGGFEDEEDFKPRNDNDNVDFDFKNEFGEAFDPNTDDVSPFGDEDDASDLIPTDYIEADELSDYTVINGEKVEREVVERALNAYSGVKEWGNQLNEHFDELDALEENINKMYSLANSEINMYIEQLEEVVNNDRYDAVKRVDALKQLNAYKAQKAGIEKAYSENYEGVIARKAHAEQLKGQTVRNELLAMGWKNPDFETTANFMIQNGIRLSAKDVSSSLMVALKKAAMYDADKNKLKEETKSNVQKAITGQPQRKSNVVSPEDVREKARAAKAAKEGKLKQEDMFKYLED